MSGCRIRSSSSPAEWFMDSAAGGRRRGRPSVLSVRSVVGQMFLLQVAVVLLLAVAGVVLLVLTTQRESVREAGSRSLAVAQGFASSPGVAEALGSQHPTAALQPRVQQAQKRTA